MRSEVDGLLGTLGLLLAALFGLGGVLAFLMSGGFERWRAEWEVARRGLEASEPIEVDGIWRMRIPAGWRRDLTRAASSAAAAHGDQGGAPAGPRLANPEFASAFFALGRYSDASGWPKASAEAEVQVPTPEAAPWEANPPHPPPTLPIWRERQRDDEGVLYVYALGSTEELERAPRVLFHATGSGVRVELRSAPGVYGLGQAIALAREMALSVEVDRTVMARLVAEYRAREAERIAAAERSRALVREHFGIAAITLAWDPAQMLPEGSFLQSTAETVKIAYRVGELPHAAGTDPAATLARYRLEPAGLEPALLARLPKNAAGTPRLRVFAVWRTEDGGMAFADFARQEPRGYHDPTIALSRALVPTLRDEALALFWIQEFAWAETERIALALAVSRAIRAAAAAGRPPWVLRAGR